MNIVTSWQRLRCVDSGMTSLCERCNVAKLDDIVCICVENCAFCVRIASSMCEMSVYWLIDVVAGDAVVGAA